MVVRVCIDAQHSPFVTSLTFPQGIAPGENIELYIGTWDIPENPPPKANTIVVDPLTKVVHVARKLDASGKRKAGTGGGGGGGGAGCGGDMTSATLSDGPAGRKKPFVPPKGENLHRSGSSSSSSSLSASSGPSGLNSVGGATGNCGRAGIAGGSSGGNAGAAGLTAKSGSGKNKCGECGQVFDSIKEISLHMQRHLVDKAPPDKATVVTLTHRPKDGSASSKATIKADPNCRTRVEVSLPLTAVESFLQTVLDQAQQLLLKHVRPRAGSTLEVRKTDSYKEGDVNRLIVLEALEQGANAEPPAAKEPLPPQRIQPRPGLPPASTAQNGSSSSSSSCSTSSGQPAAAVSVERSRSQEMDDVERALETIHAEVGEVRRSEQVPHGASQNDLRLEQPRAGPSFERQEALNTQLVPAAHSLATTLQGASANMMVNRQMLSAEQNLQVEDCSVQEPVRVVRGIAFLSEHQFKQRQHQLLQQQQQQELEQQELQRQQQQQQGLEQQELQRQQQQQQQELEQQELQRQQQQHQQQQELEQQELQRQQQQQQELEQQELQRQQQQQQRQQVLEQQELQRQQQQQQQQQQELEQQELQRQQQQQQQQELERQELQRQQQQQEHELQRQQQQQQEQELQQQQQRQHQLPQQQQQEQPQQQLNNLDDNQQPHVNGLELDERQAVGRFLQEPAPELPAAAVAGALADALRQPHRDAVEQPVQREVVPDVQHNGAEHIVAGQQAPQEVELVVPIQPAPREVEFIAPIQQAPLNPEPPRPANRIIAMVNRPSVMSLHPDARRGDDGMQDEIGSSSEAVAAAPQRFSRALMDPREPTSSADVDSTVGEAESGQGSPDNGGVDSTSALSSSHARGNEGGPCQQRMLRAVAVPLPGPSRAVVQQHRQQEVNDVVLNEAAARVAGRPRQGEADGNNRPALNRFVGGYGLQDEVQEPHSGMQ